MPEEFLNGADVVSGFEEMGSEGVAQGVGGNALLNPRFGGGSADGALQTRWVYVMAIDGRPLPCRLSGVVGTPGSRKDVLPSQFSGCARVFFGQGIGEVNFAGAFGKVFLVEETDALHLTMQGGDGGIGERHDAVFGSLAVANGDGAILKIKVFDAQAHALHEPQAGAVEELRHEFVGSGELFQEAANLVPREDGRKTLRSFGAGG